MKKGIKLLTCIFVVLLASSSVFAGQTDSTASYANDDFIQGLLDGTIEAIYEPGDLDVAIEIDSETSIAPMSRVLSQINESDSFLLDVRPVGENEYLATAVVLEGKQEGTGDGIKVYTQLNYREDYSTKDKTTIAQIIFVKGGYLGSVQSGVSCAWYEVKGHAEGSAYETPTSSRLAGFKIQDQTTGRITSPPVGDAWALNAKNYWYYYATDLLGSGIMSNTTYRSTTSKTTNSLSIKIGNLLEPSVW